MSETMIAERFKELELVELVPGTEYLLDAYSDLASTRPHSEAGPLAVTYSEIKQYCDLTDTDLDPWEVKAIRACDDAYLDETYQIINTSNQPTEATKTRKKSK